MKVRHYQTGDSFDITLRDGAIAEMVHCSIVGAETIAPSFFDIQVNGALGIGFTSNDLTTQQIRTVSDELAKHNVGGFCATVITASFETIQASFTALARARREDVQLQQRIPAFHLEGPYLSPEDGPRGAHPAEHVRDPDWSEFQTLQDAAEGRIRLVTLAPERPGAIDFIGRLCANGIIASIGHTAATPAQIRDAVSAGAGLSTHLGNGSHAMLPRHDNYLWEQLACDGLHASLIADGHHLPASLLKVILRVKSPSRLILTSDASPLAGLPPGRYQHWGTELEVDSTGRIGVSGTPFLAGSGAYLDECVQYMMEATGISFDDAIKLAAVNPRKLLRLPQPALKVGARWDFQVVPAADLSANAARL